MAYNEALTSKVRNLLEPIANVEEKKMFGSIGFIINGKLALGVGDHHDHSMMVRVGLNAYKDALKIPGAAPAIMRGKEQPGYVFLMPEAVATKEQLEKWVNLAVEYGKTLVEKKT